MRSNSKEKELHYLQKTGDVPFKMTNDYLFKALLQKNEKTLRALIESILHMKRKTIKSVHIENPIIIGDAVDEKDVVLDVNVTLNSGERLDLEMQVRDYGDWPERSLYYNIRNLARIEKGDDYESLPPVYCIGFLDYTLFPSNPEFVATYQIRHSKSGYLYTDKFRVYVVNLTRTDLATDEDKAYNIDVWARLFKATTWEDLKMLAKENKIMEETVETVCELSEDKQVFYQCRAREDRLRREAAAQRQLEQAKKDKEKAEKDKEKAEKDKEKAEKDKEKAEREREQALRDKAKSDEEAAMWKAKCAELEAQLVAKK